MTIVAFSAKLTTDVNLGLDQTVAYNKVITNVGGSYDPQTGYLTSLVKGVCIFLPPFSHFQTIKFIYIWYVIVT